MTKVNKNRLSKIQEFLIDSHDEEEISKFHQKTKWNFVNKLSLKHSLKDYYVDSITQVNTQIPDQIYNTIKLDDYDFNAKGSCRNFDSKVQIKFSDFSEIIIESFGVNSILKRKYPSAGALYSIVPIIVVLEDEIVEKISKGIYIFNYETQELYLIKKVNDDLVHEIISEIGGKEIISPLFFAYSMDISKSIAKYKMRGYRHANIEVGAIAQNVRLTLNDRSLYEVCWSGFNDDNLTRLCGMNVNKAPILLVQWWGYSAI